MASLCKGKGFLFLEKRLLIWKNLKTVRKNPVNINKIKQMKTSV